MLINLSEHFKTPRNLSQPQKGIVVANNDPRNLGRVKCVVANLLEGRLSDLPWIAPWTGGGSSGSASGDVPDIGSELIIEFKFGDIYAGFYTGAWKSYETASGLYNESYPDVLGTRDEMGNTTTINKATGTTEYKHSSGSSVTFTQSGEISIKSSSKINLLSESGKLSAIFDTATGQISFVGEKNIFGGRETELSAKLLTILAQTISETVQGGKTSEILGSLGESVSGSKTVSVAGSEATAIAGESRLLVGLSREEVIGAGETKTVVAGGITERLVAGDKTVTVVLGGVSYTLTAGNYSVSVVAGNIEIATLLGSFKCGNAIGNVEIDAAGNITLKATAMTLQSAGPMSLTSAATIELTAPMISLNKGAGGQVLTTLTQPVLDSISGTPSVGVPTVIAG